MNAITTTTRIAVTTATLVILSAGILGYTALYDLFVSIGLFSAWLGIFFPLLFDLAEVTAAVSVFNAKLQGEDDKFAWGMVILFTILGIVANIGHATTAWWVGRIDTVQVILAIFATSLFPLSVALVTHLVKRVIARDIVRRGHLSSLVELATQRDSLTTEVNQLWAEFERASTQFKQVKSEQKAIHLQQMDELNAARRAKIDQRRAEVLNLVREGMNPADIADELGVSVSTIKRDLSALNGQVR